MPETYLHIQWPDNVQDRIYSPSSAITNYFNPGEILPMTQFQSRCSEALMEASERVRQKFGFACSSAEDESFRVNAKCQTFGSSEEVRIREINNEV